MIHDTPEQIMHNYVQNYANIPLMSFEQFVRVCKKVFIIHDIKPSDKLSVDELLMIVDKYLKTRFGQKILNDEWVAI